MTDREKRLKALLTDDVLGIMEEAVKTCGWEVYHIESASFVDWCFDIANKDRAELTPYDDE